MVGKTATWDHDVLIGETNLRRSLQVLSGELSFSASHYTRAPSALVGRMNHFRRADHVVRHDGLDSSGNGIPARRVIVSHCHGELVSVSGQDKPKSFFWAIQHPISDRPAVIILQPLLLNNKAT